MQRRQITVSRETDPCARCRRRHQNMSEASMPSQPASMSSTRASLHLSSSTFEGTESAVPYPCIGERSRRITLRCLYRFHYVLCRTLQSPPYAVTKLCAAAHALTGQIASGCGGRLPSLGINVCVLDSAPRAGTWDLTPPRRCSSTEEVSSTTGGVLWLRTRRRSEKANPSEKVLRL